jgi:hypothetical protein
LDVWIAETGEPSPLAVFFHGAGGDKSEIWREYGAWSVQEFLNEGISVAAVTTPRRSVFGGSQGAQISMFLGMSEEVTAELEERSQPTFRVTIVR